MKYNKISDFLLKAFKKIVGENFYFAQYEIRFTYAFGGSIFNKDWIPDLILIPQNSKQISEILKLANDNKIAITPKQYSKAVGIAPRLAISSKKRKIYPLTTKLKIQGIISKKILTFELRFLEFTGYNKNTATITNPK